MARSSAEPVVASTKLEIGVAHAGGQQPDQREPFRPMRTAHISHFDSPVFEMNGKHE
jgi:hypothetical protein